MAKLTKQFDDAIISTLFKDYSNTTTYKYDYDPAKRTLPDLDPDGTGEEIGVAFGKIKGWLQRRREVIVGELTEGTGKISADLLPSYVDDIVDCYYNSTNGKMYSDAAKTTLLPYPADAPEYTLLTAEPADWADHYTDYYTYDDQTGEYTPVPEGAGAPTWTAETYYRHNGAGDGEKGKIYQDLGGDPIVFYRWTGTNFARTGSGEAPPVYDGSETAGLVHGSTHSTDKSRYFLGETGNWENTSVLGAAAPTFTLLAEEPDDWATNWTNYYTYDATKPHNKYTQLDTATAPTFEVDKYYAMTAAVDGKVGFVPAPTTSGYTQYQDLNNQFLRGDGEWSTDPVITADKLVINCVVSE